MLRLFNIVPHVVVTPTIKLFLLLLCNYNFATAMNCKYLKYVPPKGLRPQVENHCLTGGETLKETRGDSAYHCSGGKLVFSSNVYVLSVVMRTSVRAMRTQRNQGKSMFLLGRSTAV